MKNSKQRIRPLHFFFRTTAGFLVALLTSITFLGNGCSKFETQSHPISLQAKNSFLAKNTIFSKTTKRSDFKSSRTEDPDALNPDIINNRWNVASVPQNIPRVSECVQSNGDPGFQFLQDPGEDFDPAYDTPTYSSCDRCFTVDYQNARCLRRDPPPPPPVVQNSPGAGDGDSGDGGGGDDPLLIDLGSRSGSDFDIDKLSLSSPDEGVMLDIRGQKAQPHPHTPERISWTGDSRYAWLVLPNEHGHVLGINEMFGNHTMGPDDKYAFDGFHALRKYDGKSADGKEDFGTADQVIDQNDPVFAKLALWSDTNFNGVAERTELRKLSEVGIVALDLRYDPTFYERDIYGNEAIFKSVAQFDDGSLAAMTDIWFTFHGKKP